MHHELSISHDVLLTSCAAPAPLLRTCASGCLSVRPHLPVLLHPLGQRRAGPVCQGSWCWALGAAATCCSDVTAGCGRPGRPDPARLRGARWPVVRHEASDIWVLLGVALEVGERLLAAQRLVLKARLCVCAGCRTRRDSSTTGVRQRGCDCVRWAAGALAASCCTCFNNPHTGLAAAAGQRSNSSWWHISTHALFDAKRRTGSDTL